MGKLILSTNEAYEYAGILSSGKVLVGESKVNALEYFGFENSGADIELSYPTDA
ncbi:MAG: hypothetical protein AB8B79_20485 [Granulosicoccus sp.]